MSVPTNHASDSNSSQFSPGALSELSRNTSAISTSSSDSTSSRLLTLTPRPRPLRTFSAPRSQSPQSGSPRRNNHPHYLSTELGYSDTTQNKTRSKSRGRNVAATVEDFKFGPTLGEGSYSTVKQATHIRSGQQYAIKVLEKSHLIRRDKMSTAIAEKNALVKLAAGHPGIIRLYYTFQDDWRLYFVIDLARNGEMQTLLSRMGSLSLNCAQYYAAQVVDAIDYMHSKGVIHRDLKPENLLLDDNYRIKITDFGTGKVLESGVEKAATWVGTAQYVAPELLEAKETSKSSDFWALGCITYQMIAGRFAFQGPSEYLTWQKIKQLEYNFPDGFDEHAKDLVQKLFVREPTKRLGVGVPGSENDFEALRCHPFFASINWKTLWTDPPPPLEAGLFKKDILLPKGVDDAWDNVGAAWDDLVGGGDDDSIDWAPDAQHGVTSIVEIGPMGEIRKPLATEGDAASETQPPDVQYQEENQPQKPRSNSAELPAAGTSSSSEESPIGHIEQVMDSLTISAPRYPPADTQDGSDDEGRGRNKVLSPVQGNGPTIDVDFSSVLQLPDDEKVIFHSNVETRSRHHLANRLIPLPVPVSKPKTRQLVLTTRRLLCLKQQQKDGSVVVKTELALRASAKLKEKDRERDSRGIIASIERKGDREFVISTSSKTFNFSAKNSTLAHTWVENINEALVSSGRPLPKAKA